MKKKLLVLSVMLLFLFATASVLAESASGIPEDATFFNGHSYYVFDNSKSWTAAKNSCALLGGHLVTISDAEENSFVVSIANTKNIYWLGMKLFGDGEYRWITGEEVTYTNFHSSEPDNYNGNQGYCIILGKSMGGSGWDAGLWGDLEEDANSWDSMSFWGSDNVGYVCEWDFLPGEEPTAPVPTGVAIDETNFPDKAFRKNAKCFDVDDDDFLSDEEIAGAVDMGCADCGIESLQGIEYFTALKVLYCNKNKLTSLDVSKNTALEELHCCENELTALDVSQNTALKVLDCWANQLTALDLSHNTALENLECEQNQLKTLDLSRNPALTHLYCSQNQLKSLNVSQNTALIHLECHVNRLTALDVSKNTALKMIACQSNKLKTLDVSKNKALLILHCHDNRIQKLDVIKVPALAALVKEADPAEYDGLHDWQKDEDGDGAPEKQLIVDQKVEVVAEKPNLDKAKVSAIKDQAYTGKAIKPAVVVRYNNKKLTADKDYTVAYKNNKKIGTATITITGKGNYTGKKTVKFNIVPKAVKLSSLTAGKKQLTVKWAKGSGITGYEIQYSLKKSFNKPTTVTIEKASTTKTVLKDLAAKKLYYVRIRAYKTVNGTKYYSAWSVIKNAKTK